MNFIYEDTSLTPRIVARTTGYLDWSSQPSLFKHYPEFLFRYSFGDIEALRVVELARMISATTQIASKPYHKLTSPSAGNLHPVELYVQIRGIKGVLSGIYHVDAGRSELVLIQEIEKDGLESYVGIEGSLHGMLFVISTVPFRAEWKYKERAIRYCYLDVGHQVATLGSSLKLFGHKMTILSEFNKTDLNEIMGFRDEEFVCATAYIGDIREKNTTLIKNSLMQVSPTDYSELNSSLVKSIKKNELLRTQELTIRANIQEESILKRRSARKFDAGTGMKKEYLEEFLNFSKYVEYPLSLYTIVLNSEHIKAGIYKKSICMKEGLFIEEICSLLVNQKFVKDADIVHIFTSKYFSANTLMKSAIYTHDIYMQAEQMGVGCTGIGAFYDKQIQKFFEIDEYILYVSAVGVTLT
ncbi:MAG: nitroreductase family protein [Campylobacterales bacterium]|nr:nitroreductase family protein [Campylobacterales bacterium]